jgi:type I restriction enzyme, S subunit
MMQHPRLAELTIKIGSGQTPTGGYRAYLPDGIPLVRSQNVLMGKFSNEGLVFISDRIDSEMAGSRVQQGDVLLNITGASIGRVCVVPDALCPANVNQHVCIIRCSDLLDPEYLAGLLASPGFQDLISDLEAGGTRQALTKTMIEDFKIPALPLETQKRMAASLKAQLAEVETARDAVTAQLRDVQALTDAIYRGTFPRLDEASVANSELQLKKIGTVAETTSGTTPSRSERKYWQPGTVPWVKTGEIVFEVIRNTEEAVSDVAVRECSLPLLPIGTVLIAMYGQGKTRGQSAILDIEATTNQACFAILPNDTFSPQYLQYWLQASYHSLRQLSEGRGGNQANLNGEMLRELSVPWVVRSEQEKIVEKLRRELAEVAAIRKALELKNSEINLLPQKILSAAFEM